LSPLSSGPAPSSWPTAALPDPRPGSVEAWCLELVSTLRLPSKLDPPLPPDTALDASWEAAAPARRPARPGRPPELVPAVHGPRTPSAQALRSPEVRARLLHTLMHHEVQAAELFAWAVLAFPDSPRALRAGLLRLCGEELAHARLYAAELERLGSRIGAFPVRDWFWEHVPRCPDMAAFVGFVGLGLEGGNLEHCARFAGRFRDAGDARAARLMEHVEAEETAHVAFARVWFERLTGAPLDYDRWRERLPAPLTPAMLRGTPLNLDARRRAGLDEAFLGALAAEPPTWKPRGTARGREQRP